MRVWRRWVLPILSIVVIGSIAVALVKIAFFPNEEVAEAAEPTGTLTAPQVQVSSGSVVSEIIVDAKVARDAEVAVKAQASGEVTEVRVARGAEVAKGAVLFVVKQSYPWRIVNVVAPVAGEVTGLDVIKGQPVSIGQEVGKVEPFTHHVTGTIEPTMLYRLLDAPDEATATIQGGPAPFECTGLEIDVSAEGVASVTCDVPKEVTVFAGLPVSLAIQAGTANDVLTVPVTAVKGGAGTGLVWVAGTGGETEERQVTLGLSDGTVVEVVDGLRAGDTVLEFVPGLENQQGEESCWTAPDGSMMCEIVQW